MIRLKCNYGRRFKAGAEIPVEEIGQAEFLRLQGQGLAEIVVLVPAGTGGADFASKLAEYVTSLGVQIDALIVIVDLAEQGGDDEAIALREAFEGFGRVLDERLEGRLDALMSRARLAHPALKPFIGEFDDMRGASNMFDDLHGPDSIDGGQAGDLVVAFDGSEGIIGGATETTIPENSPPALVEVAELPAADASALAATTDTPRSEGAAAGEAAEAPAVVVEPTVVDTPEAAPKAPAKTGGRKKSEAA